MPFRPFRAVRHFVEYAVVWIISLFLRLLPLAAAQGVAWVLARAAYCVMASRRNEAKRRLRFLMGKEATRQEIADAAWISFRNIVFNAVDMFRIRMFSRKDAERRIEDLRVAVAHIRRTLEKAGGSGAILALPHCGNWDLAGSAVFLSGVPIFSVAGKQRNPWMNRWINRMRAGRGMVVLERGESGGRTYLEMLRRIKRGEVFAILPDTRSRTPALPVPFLGGTANIARGMGLLSWQTGAPVIPLVIRRTSWRRFIIDFHPTVWPDRSAPRDAEELRITREVLDRFDADIRATPDQWFWYNKRWGLDPGEKDALGGAPESNIPLSENPEAPEPEAEAAGHRPAAEEAPEPAPAPEAAAPEPAPEVEAAEHRSAAEEPAPETPAPEPAPGAEAAGPRPAAQPAPGPSSSAKGSRKSKKAKKRKKKRG